MRSKKTFYNISSNLLLQIIIIIYGFVVPKIIIVHFGSSVNGLVSSIAQFLGYIALLESGFGPVVKSVLYKPIAKKNKQEITNILSASEKFFRVISRVFIVYIILLGVLYPLLINNEFDFVFTCSLIIIISISSLTEYYFGMTYNLYLQAEQKNYIASSIQCVLYIINILLVLLLVKLNSSIHVIKLITGLVFIIRPIIQNYYVKKKYGINLKKADNNFQIKQKWDGLVQHIAYVIHSNTDITVLTIFTTLKEVSVYSVYYMVVKGVRAIIQSFTNGMDAFFGGMIAKNENLVRDFSAYEILYFGVVTIFYSCTFVLLVPFINVYTLGITDANYIRYTFAYLLVISEVIYAIRIPYSSIIFAAGHFKETKKGAIVEAITNITISIILVQFYGIIGVIIGTIVSMLIRTSEFIYHSNKFILKRNIFDSLKKIICIVITVLIVWLLSSEIITFKEVSYISWFINAIIIFVIALFITILINLVINYKQCKDILRVLKNRIEKVKRQ